MLYQVAAVILGWSIPLLVACGEMPFKCGILRNSVLSISVRNIRHCLCDDFTEGAVLMPGARFVPHGI